MRFSGRLQIEADPVEWLKTDLSLTQGRVELTSGNEVLGSWSMSQVKAERIEGDRFELLLGDDRALFAADDALAFSYEAMPHLTKRHIIAGPTGLRGRIRNSLRNNERHPAEHKPEMPAQVAQNVAPNAKGSPESINHPVARRLRDLIEAASQEQASQGESAADAVQNGGGGVTDEFAEVKHPLGHTDAEKDASTSEFALVAPIYEFEAEFVSAAEPEFETPSSAPVVWPTSPPEPEPTDLVLPSPPRRNAIRLDLEPAFARASPRDDEPEDWVMVALEGLLAEVRKGSMTPAQVGAITDLVQAVTDLVAARRGSNPS